MFHPYLHHPFASGLVGLLILVGFILVAGLLIAALVDLVRSRRQRRAFTPMSTTSAASGVPADPAEAILRERLARGEIDVPAFEAARNALGLK